MNDNIFELIRQGYTIVTAGTRISRYLRNQYAQAMLENGMQVWETPDILPWQAWLVRCWNELPLSQQTDLLLLNSSQQRYLWQQVIDLQYAGRLLHINRLADQAMNTCSLCKDWCIPVFPAGTCLNQDAMAFRSWTQEYQRLLEKNHWIDHAGIAEFLCRHTLLHEQHKLALYGFDELTPLQQQLMAVLGKAGCIVQQPAVVNKNRAVRAYRFPDIRDETRSAALWARQIINRETDVSVGIVVPELRASRQHISNIFDEVFHPGLLAGEGYSLYRHYNIALGIPLSEYPLVHIALQILSLGRGKHPLHKLSGILRSPFIKGADTEQAFRARFDAALRETGEHEWRLKTLIEFAGSNIERFGNAHSLVNILKEYEIHYLSCARQQTPAEWARVFTERLRLFGWPGDRSLDSSEYQCLQAWNEALSVLASVGTVAKPCSGRDALTQLVRITGVTGFQPETPEAPVQIMGWTGAAAMQFDYLWVTGLHDQIWPSAIQPNPYIPLVLQQQARMPDASAELNLHRAKVLTGTLINSAAEVVLSYPAIDADRECRISPVIREYQVDGSPLQAGDDADYRYLIHRSAKLESFADQQAPALSGQATIKGGSGIFRDQAACPFRAFARHRLFAEGLAVVDIGLNAAIRGSLVHRVMQYLWQRLKSSENLHGYSAAALDVLIDSVVVAAIDEQTKLQPGSLSSRFAALEKERLRNLARGWLIQERERPAFKVIEVENWHSVRVGGLVCNLRIDRIDQLADGRLIILDYKTGEVTPRSWDGERPEDPQLPLYAVCTEGDIAAVAYARLKTGAMHFVGIAGMDGLLPGVGAATDEETGVAGWTSRLQEWRMVLEHLAEGFLAGNARVDPKNHNTCRYCDLHTLCRIHEFASAGDEDE